MLLVLPSLYMASKVGGLSRGPPKAPFSIGPIPRCRGGHYTFPWIAPLYH